MTPPVGQGECHSGALAVTAPNKRDELLALALRVEQSTGADRELDKDVLTHPAFGYRDVHGDGMMFDRGNEGYWWLDDCNIHQLPSPTSSLDAAMTLCSQPPSFDLDHDHERQGGAWNALVGDHAGWTPDGSATAATPALALTAACLRALAHKEPTT